MPDFYDTHAHLDYPDFASDLEQVISRAQLAGIAKIICIGTDLESSRRTIQLAEKFQQVFAVVGWHPSNAAGAPEDLRPALRELAAHPKVAALGETGLDYHHLPTEKPGHTAEDDQRYKQKQASVFQQHLEVAAELGLNCVIHQRDSIEDTINQLAPFSNRVRGVFHCFVDSIQTQRRIQTLGSLVSFTGIVTFKNAHSLRETVAGTPMGQFMLETDCPFLAPMPHRGKRCEPGHVDQIAQTVAQTKGCTLEELSAATCAAAQNFFPKIVR